MDDFDYKKYSLEKIQEWVHDALNTSEASPHEIYSAIREAVRDDYYCYKHHASRAYGLLALLNGERPVKDEEYPSTSVKYDEHMKSYVPYVCDKDDKSSECQKAWTNFWEENYYPEEHQKHNEEVKDDGMRPWGHSDLEYLCNQSSEEEKQKCREYNLREAEYYDKRVQLDSKQDKVVKWQLPVEVDGISGEYYVQFPDDLMEAANIKEDDLVEWIDRGDGSFELRKVTKPLGLDEC